MMGIKNSAKNGVNPEKIRVIKDWLI